MTLLDQIREIRDSLHVMDTQSANLRAQVNELYEQVKRSEESGPSVFDPDNTVADPQEPDVFDSWTRVFGSADPTSDSAGGGGE